MRFSFFVCIFVLHVSTSGFAQAEGLPSSVNDVTEVDLRQSAIDFVNVTASPGLEGAMMEVDQPYRSSNIVRSSLGFGADFTLRKTLVDGYWGAAIVAGSIDEELFFEGDDLPVTVQYDRRVVGLRGSLGLSVPVNKNLRVRPYLTVIAARLTTDSTIEGVTRLDASLELPVKAYNISTSVDTLGLAGTLEADYFYWVEDYKVSALAQYSLNYTDSSSLESAHLNSHDWSQAVILKTNLRSPTGWKTDNRPWLWMIYANYTDFLDQSKFSLGFTHFYEVGVGIDWEWRIKPLNWFGLRAVGIKAGYIKGDGVTGYNLGLTMR